MSLILSWMTQKTKHNFVDSGFVDSIGLLAFMSDIEAEYGITFSEEELNSNEFRTIGTLVEMINSKINE